MSDLLKVFYDRQQLALCLGAVPHIRLELLAVTLQTDEFPTSEKLSKMAKQVRPSLQLDNALNIFACLDRFSLDSIGFTCPTLKGIVDKHLPEEPLRVLESVTIKWYENSLTATIVPESPLGKKMELMAVDDAIKKDVKIDAQNDADDAMEDEDDEDDERCYEG
ncbi:hypothetical protein AAVH_16306 [Aphelenchoides avenae]|nr:hypothetical protein AAVH_16306 [Aphelenchus avenae]